MKKFKVIAITFLKDGLFDPQGQAVEKLVQELNVKAYGFRVGRSIQFTMEAESKEEVLKVVNEKLSRIIANPITETFKVQIEEC